VEVLPVRPCAETTWWDRLRLTIQLANRVSQPTKLLSLVLDPGSLDELQPRNLVLDEANACAHQVAAAVLNEQCRMMKGCSLDKTAPPEQRHKAQAGG
jgi:hypothetical protein